MGYWPFEGTAADASGNGRDLTLQGSAAISAGGVGGGQALNLPGNNNSYGIRGTDDGAFDFRASDFSIQVWFKTASFAKQQTLIEKFYRRSGPGWTLHGPGRHPASSSYSQPDWSSERGWADGQRLGTRLWSRVQGAVLTIYVNGVPGGTGNYGTTAITTSPTAPGGEAQLGRRARFFGEWIPLTRSESGIARSARPKSLRCLVQMGDFDVGNGMRCKRRGIGRMSPQEQLHSPHVAQMSHGGADRNGILRPCTNSAIQIALSLFAQCSSLPDQDHLARVRARLRPTSRISPNLAGARPQT